MDNPNTREKVYDQMRLIWSDLYALELFQWRTAAIDATGSC